VGGCLSVARVTLRGRKDASLIISLKGIGCGDLELSGDKESMTEGRDWFGCCTALPQIKKPASVLRCGTNLQIHQNSWRLPLLENEPGYMRCRRGP